MFCENCGSKIDENSKFCPTCGSEIDIDETNGISTDVSENDVSAGEGFVPVDVKLKRKNYLPFVIIGIAVLIVGVFVVLLVFKIIPENKSFDEASVAATLRETTISKETYSEAPTSEPETVKPTEEPFSITEEALKAEIEKIREYYYSPGEKDIKIVLQNGENGWNYSRDYRFHDGKLVFAFIFNGTEEHRLYFKDDHMIRYIDEEHITYDYPDTSEFSSWEERAIKEAYEQYNEKYASSKANKDWESTYQSFINEKKYLDLDLEFGNASDLLIYLYDIDHDGIPELVITNGQAGRAVRFAYIFSMINNSVEYLGIGPTDAFYNPSDSKSPLYGRYSDTAESEFWTEYRKEGKTIKTTTETKEYKRFEGHTDYVIITTSPITDFSKAASSFSYVEPDWLGTWKSSNGESIEVTSVTESGITVIYNHLNEIGDKWLHTTMQMVYTDSEHRTVIEDLDADTWKYTYTLCDGYLLVESRYPDAKFYKE